MNNSKKRYKSHILLAHEALFRRLKYKYRFNETILADYQRYKAGFYGEKSVDYKLSLFPNNHFHHYPDLRLQNNINFFQIDSVIITPKLIFNLEAKNLKGIIQYDAKQRQLIQINGDKEKCYKDPLLQAETQKKHLDCWLRKIGYSVPIEPIVISTNPNAIIRNPDGDKEFQHRFVTLENFLYKMDEIYNYYNVEILSPVDIQRLYNIFAKNNTPLKSDLINLYKIKAKHLISGVPCEQCGFFPIEKYLKTWICPKCKKTDIKGYQRVILDYFLLHNPFITNGICRNLLNVTSPNTAYYILKSLNLKTTGFNKNRQYLAPPLWDFPQDGLPKQFEVSIFER